MSELPLLPMASIQAGDLLAWSHDPYSTITDLTLKTIAKITKSDYGHVGIAWRCHDGIDDELFVVEATIPKIRIARVTTDRPFHCVPMGIEWNNFNKSFLLSKLDYPYGVLDALRGSLGWRAHRDMKWQCAELAHAFYEASGIFLRKEYTPGQLIKNAMEHTGSRVYRVVGPNRTISMTD